MMVRIVALTAQGLVLAFLAYEMVVSLWGWRNPRPAVSSDRAQRFRVVIPAHNEASVIGGVLSDIAAQDYPRQLMRAVVVADRCEDDTAVVASALGEVAERVDGAGGKGSALDWYLSRQPLDVDEALVVFDADSRVPAQAISSISDEFAAGHTVCQLYLDVENPTGSPLATASALSYWAGNRMVQLARHNLGWSADLGGTGMAFMPAAVTDLGLFGHGLTEDQSALARLVVAGHRVRWLHDVRLRDEKPEGVGVAVRQRARWVAGKRAVARQQAGSLLRRAGETRSWAPVDVAIRLVQPGRSFAALVAGILAVVAGITGSNLFFPWWVWASAAAVVVTAPVAFLLRDRVPLRYVARYPLVLLVALLWIPVRLASRAVGSEWRRTERRAERA